MKPKERTISALRNNKVLTKQELRAKERRKFEHDPDLIELFDLLCAAQDAPTADEKIALIERIGTRAGEMGKSIQIT